MPDDPFLELLRREQRARRQVPADEEDVEEPVGPVNYAALGEEPGEAPEAPASLGRKLLGGSIGRFQEAALILNKLFGQPALRAATGAGQLGAAALHKIAPRKESDILGPALARRGGEHLLQSISQPLSVLLNPERLGLPAAERAITGGEALEEVGVPAGPETGIGSLRSVGGFAGEVLLPAPGAGLFAKAVLGGTAKVSGAAVKALERVGKVPVVGAPARAALAGGGLFSRRFANRATPIAAEAAEAQELTENLYQLVGRAEAVEFDKAWRAATEATQKAAKKGFEKLGVQQELIARVGGRPGIDVIKEAAEAESRQLFGSAKKIGRKFLERERPVLEATAEKIRAEWQSKLSHAKKYLDSLTPASHVLVHRWYFGSPEVAEKFGMNLGRIAREEKLLGMGLLDRNQVIGLARKHGVAYAEHDFLSPEEWARKILGDVVAANPKLSGMSLGSVLAKVRAGTSKERKIGGTLDELEKQFPGIVTQNPAHLISLGSARVAKSVPATDWTRTVLSAYGKDAIAFKPVAGGTTHWLPENGFVVPKAQEIPAEMRRHFFRESIETTSKGKTIVREIPKQIPVQVWSDMAPMLKRVASDPSLNGFKAAWERWKRWFPAWTVLPFPGTWVWNAFSGAFRNFMHLGPEHTAWMGTAGKILRGPGAIPVVPIERGMKYGQFMQEAILDGVYGKRGWAGTAAGHVMADAAFDPKPSTLRRLFSLDEKVNFATTIGAWVQNTADDFNRLAAYLTLRAKHGREFAKNEMLKFQYDPGTALSTKFQREFVRGVYPFFGWMRWNVPASLRELATRPKAVGAVGIRVNESGEADIPEWAMPFWIQQAAGVPVGRGPDGKSRVYVLNQWVPFLDLERLDTPTKALAYLAQNLTPLIREPAQQAFDYDLFFQRAITDPRYPEKENFLGANVPRRLSHALRALRLLNEADRVLVPKPAGTMWDDIVEETNVVERGLRAIGIKAYSFDGAELKRKLLNGFKREIAELKGKRKFLVRQGRPVDLENAAAIEKRIAELHAKIAFASGWDPDTDLKLQDLGYRSRR